MYARIALRHRMTRVVVVACLGLFCSPAGPVVGADMSAYDVTSMLFRANPDGSVELSDKDLSRLDLSGLNFKRARLSGANLFGADLTDADLQGVDLSGAILDRATVTRASFAHANLNRATLLRPNIHTTLEPSAGERTNFIGATMIEVRISGRLDLVSFATADLTGAVFAPINRDGETLITPRTDLNGCDFTAARLVNADLSFNALQFTRFVTADVRGARFVNADLSGADFSDADVSGADFSGAVLVDTRFDRAKGLESAVGLNLQNP